MSIFRVATAGVSIFAFVLTPDVALAAGGSAARSASARIRHNTQSPRHPDATGRQRSAAPGYAKPRADVLLAPGSGYRQATGSARVRVLQHRLARSGFAPGPIDGRYGPLTTKAVVHFQAAQRLGVDGMYGPITARALTRYLRARSKLSATAAAHSARRVRPPHSSALLARPDARRTAVPTTVPSPSPSPSASPGPSASRIASRPVSGVSLGVWLMLGGTIATAALLMVAALAFRPRMRPRPRRYVSPRTLVIAQRTGFRYSHYRDAYVLRLVGSRFGPVLKSNPTPSDLREPPLRRRPRRTPASPPPIITGPGSRATLADDTTRYV